MDDLSVVSVATTSVTLGWTQVNDGEDGVPNYLVRYGSPTISWEAANGTEALVYGTAIGSPIQHTYTDLLPGTAYQFQVVAFRGTTLEDIVPGGFSNVASATTLTALAAGTAIATPGDGVVELSAQAPAGGAPPYSYQWHRSTSGGFVPGPGNALAGFTSLDETDTDVSNGTTYYYVLIATDAEDESVAYAQVSATPTMPDLSYPNLPAGMSVIGSFDGTVEAANGHAFGIADFGGWSVDPAAPASVIEVVADATNPTGSGSSLRFTFNQAYNPRAGSATANAFTGGPYKELYVHVWIFFESDWTFGSKIFYLGAAPGSRNNTGSPTQFYNGNLGGRHRVTQQNSGSPEDELVDSGEGPPKGISQSPIGTGEWVRLEYHLIAESSPGANDGAIYTWINGVNAGYRTGVGWVNAGDPAVGFSGMEWYADANSVPVQSYYRVGNLHIAGK